MSEPKGRGPAWTPLVPPDPPQGRRRSDEGPPSQAARPARRGLKSAPEASEWPLGSVTVLGAHILDVLGRPVETIPPGQGSVRLREIRATAGLLAGATPLDAAWLGLARGALVATGLGSDAGIENLGQVLDFLSGTQPAVAGRIKERM